MHKKLVAQLALAGSVGLAAVLSAGMAGATDCNACHTMHNSQDGAPMRIGGGVTPLPVLLLDSCVGCHSGLNAVDPTGAGLQPKVNGLTEPGYMGGANNSLAGGDFYWVGLDDAKGHNVVGLDGLDGNFTNPLLPPGGTALTAQLECAGTNGCHGDRTILNSLASLEGAHHYAHNTTAAPLTTATEVGNSFRYLLGVYGAEDTDWQWTEGAADHNRYWGVNRDSALAAQATTISGLCAQCHNAYHNTAAGASDNFGINVDNSNFNGAGTWIRHPTDLAMPLAGQYASYTAEGYSVEAPVGRSTNLTDDTVDALDERIVLCISCHRAHGSPFDDLLRWDYGTMDTGTSVTTGCMRCHRGK